MDEPDEWRAFEAIAITTHPIPAYGGFRAGIELLQQMADQFNSEPVPMHAQHNLTDPIRTRDVSASVREREDGYHELVLRGEVLAVDWDRVQHMSGMSVTVLVPLEGDDPSAEIRLAADAGWFADDDIAAASAIVETSASTSPARAYQFALVADPQVFVDVSLVTLEALGLNLAASALWDGLKHLLARRKVPSGADPEQRTVINVSVTDLGGWAAAVETNDPQVAATALEKLMDAALKAKALSARSGAVPSPVRWDESTGEWRPTTPGSDGSSGSDDDGPSLDLPEA